MHMHSERLGEALDLVGGEALQALARCRGELDELGRRRLELQEEPLGAVHESEKPVETVERAVPEKVLS